MEGTLVMPLCPPAISTACPRALAQPSSFCEHCWGWARGPLLSSWCGALPLSAWPVLQTAAAWCLEPIQGHARVLQCRCP